MGSSETVLSKLSIGVGHQQGGRFEHPLTFERYPKQVGYYEGCSFSADEYRVGLQGVQGGIYFAQLLQGLQQTSDDEVSILTEELCILDYMPQV